MKNLDYFYFQLFEIGFRVSISESFYLISIFDFTFCINSRFVNRALFKFKYTRDLTIVNFLFINFEFNHE